MDSPNTFDIFDPSNYSHSPISESQFICYLCGKSAGNIQLYGTKEKALLIRTTFIGDTRGPINPKYFENCRRAIDSSDALALYSLNKEWAAFYCPECEKCYCGKHWTWWDIFEDDQIEGWYDCTEGICPEGHRRILED